MLLLVLHPRTLSQLQASTTEGVLTAMYIMHDSSVQVQILRTCGYFGSGF
jgi:hypothetical protein